MAFFNFGTARKARQFDYKPRFYDPETEERAERRRQILGEESGEEYKPGMYIREKRLQRMRDQDQRMRRIRSRATFTRTIIFVALALGVLYLLFNYFGQSF